MISNLSEIFLVFLRLGLTSFGGPIAHLGFFQTEFVKKRNWLDNQSYADLVALCQILPGPASSQVGMAVGYFRGGYLGALIAWLGFTLPSAVLMILVGYGIAGTSQLLSAATLHGLKIAAVAVVAHAVYSMSKSICVDKTRIAMAVLAAALALFVENAFGQILIILMGAAAGVLFLKSNSTPLLLGHLQKGSKKVASILLVAFFLLLGALPLAGKLTGDPTIQQFDSFFRTGSLVFGGGHVVLPILKNEIVNQGWVSSVDFLSGYGAAQALPGPLFTFSAYLGTVSAVTPGGAAGGLLALVAIFLPSFLLVLGVIPYWSQMIKNENLQSAIQGVNATVVGLLAAAFYNPVWKSAIFTMTDLAFAIVAFCLLTFTRTPAWLIVILAAIVPALIPVYA
ncbi:chromate efflux transporter [Bdellovibrio sp. HCB274]|uniref:chromate efflux transporter n=1 Tax=Bdellovibrio sp. HCB274 TaxID=3394361 RepID=UPI0039B54B92